MFIFFLSGNAGKALTKKNNGNKYDHLYQKALEGFAFILAEEGDIVYLSENVARYLGLQQVKAFPCGRSGFTV